MFKHAFVMFVPKCKGVGQEIVHEFVRTAVGVLVGNVVGCSVGVRLWAVLLGA